MWLCVSPHSTDVYLEQEAQLPQRNSASDTHVSLGWLAIMFRPKRRLKSIVNWLSYGRRQIGHFLATRVRISSLCLRSRRNTAVLCGGCAALSWRLNESCVNYVHDFNKPISCPHTRWASWCPSCRCCNVMCTWQLRGNSAIGLYPRLLQRRWPLFPTRSRLC